MLVTDTISFVMLAVQPSIPFVRLPASLLCLIVQLVSRKVRDKSFAMPWIAISFVYSIGLSSGRFAKGGTSLLARDILCLFGAIDVRPFPFLPDDRGPRPISYE